MAVDGSTTLLLHNTNLNDRVKRRTPVQNKNTPNFACLQQDTKVMLKRIWQRKKRKEKHPVQSVMFGANPIQHITE
jgi:hypothetical protein